MTSGQARRQQELRERLAELSERIATATRACGRETEPTLIVVTKFFPVEDLIAVVDAGARDVGENREQELVSKVAYLGEHRPDVLDKVNLHFIGQLQSKKAKRVAMAADVVHSLDREKLIAPLAGAASEAGKPLEVLIQVDLEAQSHGRGGVLPGELEKLAASVENEKGLRLTGLMAVAPLGEAPAAAFERLAKIRARFLEQHPHADTLSAGMTADLEEAVAIGATHLRVGRAILGSRPGAG